MKDFKAVAFKNCGDRKVYVYYTDHQGTRHNKAMTRLELNELLRNQPEVYKTLKTQIAF